MSDKKNTGITRLIKAAGYSLTGLKTAFRDEAAFRQEVVLLTILIPIAVWLGQNGIERAILIASLIIVLIVELVNSSIENTVNRIGPEKHILSGQAKDIASAAVFLSLLNVVIVWALILIPGT